MATIYTDCFWRRKDGTCTFTPIATEVPHPVVPIVALDYVASEQGTFKRSFCFHLNPHYGWARCT